MSTTQQTVPEWVSKIAALNLYLIRDFLGGSRPITIAFAINAHKFLTAFIVFYLMWKFNNYTKEMWVYLALHGSYGFCWLLKHFTFRDPKWEQKSTIGGSVFLFIFLATYWAAPYLLASSTPRPEMSNGFLSFCIALFTLGSVIVYASDCQKHYTLRYNKGLITEGFYKYVRHPNYLGEMMIYGSFALLAQHWLPWLILAYWWTAMFYVNMQLIDASLSRYPGWEEYKVRTGMLLPSFNTKRII